MATWLGCHRRAFEWFAGVPHRAYANAVRKQSEAMEKAAQAQRREKWSMDQLRRIGRAVGVDDPAQLARSVEKLVAKSKETAG